MPDKDDLRRIALSMEGVTTSAKDTYAFDRDGRGMIWPYPERVHPKKARVLELQHVLHARRGRR